MSGLGKTAFILGLLAVLGLPGRAHAYTCGATITNAEISFMADDTASVWVHGTQVATGSIFSAIDTVNITTELNSGTGDIVIADTNTNPDYVAVFYLVTIEYSDGSLITFSSNSPAANDPVTLWWEPTDTTAFENPPGPGWQTSFSNSNASAYLGMAPGYGYQTLTGGPAGLSGSVTVGAASPFANADCNCGTGTAYYDIKLENPCGLPTPTPTPATCGSLTLLNATNVSNGCPGAADNNITYDNPAGLNPLLLVKIEAGTGNPVPTTVTYGGLAMTLLGGTTHTTSSGGYEGTWYLTGAPGGNNTLTIDLASAPCSWNVVVEAWDGANQTNPIGANNFTTSGGACESTWSDSLTATASDSVLDDFLVMGNLPQWGMGTGLEQAAEGFTSGYYDEVYGDYMTVGGIGSYGLTYEPSSCEAYTSQLVEILAAPCGSPTATPSATPTATPTATLTDSFTETFTVSPTDTPTGTPTDTGTLTATPTATSTLTSTTTGTPTLTGTSTPTPSFSVTGTATVTESSTASSTLTSTDSPTETVTASSTPSSTDSPQGTATDTPTGTPTSTATSTPTASPTLTATPSQTGTSTASFTTTSTPTDTDTPTASLTSTATATSTLTTTSSATPTDTCTRTASPTSTATPSPTTSFTSTRTFTATDTPIPEPYTVTVGIYNSAGELVRSLYSGSSEYPADQAEVQQAAGSNGQQVVDIMGLDGSAGSTLVWNETNNNGQAVQSGVYQMQITSTNNYGQVTARDVSVSVIATFGTLSLNVYNGAGELVANLGTQLAGVTSTVTGMSLEPSSGSAVVPSTDTDAAPPLTIKISLADGGSLTVPWYGLGSQGQPLQPGNYMVTLSSSSAGMDEILGSKTVVLLGARDTSAQGMVSSALVVPNPVNGAGFRVYYRQDGTDTAAGILYTLKGERVAEATDRGGGVLDMAGNWPPGIYLLDFEVHNGLAGVPARRILKVAVVRR